MAGKRRKRLSRVHKLANFRVAYAGVIYVRISPFELFSNIEKDWDE